MARVCIPALLERLCDLGPVIPLPMFTRLACVRNIAME